MAYAIRSYPFGADDWTPITPPYACSGFGIRNAGGNDAVIRTNKDDEATEDVLGIGQWEIVSNSATVKLFSNIRPLFWVKSVSGPGLLKGRFVY